MHSPFYLITGTFYTFPLMMFLNILFLSVLFTRKRSLPYYTLFKIYGLLALMQVVVSISTTFTDPTYKLIMLVTFIETIAFYSFFVFHAKKHVFRKRIIRVRNAFIISSVGLICATFILFPSKYAGLVTGYYVVACNLINLAPAFLYVYNLMRPPPAFDFTCRSALWINIGILVLNSIEIPLFLTNEYLSLHKVYWFQAYCEAANFWAYCFLFSTFSIALFFSQDDNEVVTEGTA